MSSRAMAAVHATGLRKSKHRSMKDETMDSLFDCSAKEALQNARTWVERCTDVEQHHNTLREYLEDGTVLCKLIQTIRPGLIKRMNKLRSPFAYWENLSFFLEACKQLGLQDSQLFDPEDLLNAPVKLYRSISLPEHEDKKIKSVVLTLYWLSRVVQQSPQYSGPHLDQSCFRGTPTLSKGVIHFDFDCYSSPTPSSTPSHTPLPASHAPDHNLISTYSPLSDPQPTPPSSPTIDPATAESRESPLIWIQQVSNLQSLFTGQQASSEFLEEQDEDLEADKSDHQIDTPVTRQSSQSKTSPGTAHSSRSQKEFSSDLVFVHGSTSSSVLSPTTGHHLEGLTSTAATGVHFSPHHLSNTYGLGTDTIDSTGLLPLETEEQLDFHSQVFTGSASQDSVPHFSPRESEGNFHVNLTQTSQPDNYSISDNTQPEPDDNCQHNLPAISEIPNSTPIDTFDLHCNSTHHSHTGVNCHSYSQEYIGRPTSSSQPDKEELISNQVSLTSVHSERNSSRSTQSSVDSVIAVVSSTKESPEWTQDSVHSQENSDTEQPQSITPSTSVSSKTPVPQEDYFSDSESDMATGQGNRSSTKRLMRVVPSELTAPKNNGKMMDFLLTVLPGEKHLGFGVLGGKLEAIPPSIETITGDSPASRAGLKPGDELITVNGRTVQGMLHSEIIDSLQQASLSQKVFMTIRRHSTAGLSPQSSAKPAVTHPSAREVYQNGFSAPPQPKERPIRKDLVAISTGLDMQRVHSDALPQHQVARKVVYVETAGASTNRTSREENSSDDIPSDFNNHAVEFSSSVESGSHHSMSSIDVVDVGTRSEASPELPPDAKQQERVQEVVMESRRPVASRTVQRNRIEEEDEEDDSLRSHSDVLLMGNKVDERKKVNASFDERALATYTVQSNHTSKYPRATSEPPSLHLTMNDLSATKKTSLDSLSPQLQIDEIWREVEESSREQQGGGMPLLVEPDLEKEEERTVTEPLEEHSVPSAGASPYSSHSASSSANLRRKSASKTQQSKGIDALLNMLRSLNEKVGTYDEEDEFKMLEELLQSSHFMKAKSFYDKMQCLATQAKDSPLPEARRIVPATRQIRFIVRERVEPTKETDELRKLLRNPHLQSLLFCHDKVSTRDFYVPATFFPKSAQEQEDVVMYHSAVDLTASSLYVSKEAPLSRDVPSSRKENATIVYLQRTNRPLGCTIYKQEDAVFVGKLQKGCDAEQSGVVKEGDELLEINGSALIGKTTDEIIRIMTGEVGKVLAFTLIPVHDDNIDLDYEEKYVRAHFGYSSELDTEVPCRELALTFQKGDILEVSNQDDPDWWQARKVFDDGGESLPGLIPARQLQQKREVLRLSYGVSVALEEKNKKKGLLSRLSKKKKKKIYYNHNPLSGALQSVGHEVATYEDVVKLMPDLQRKRPIVLIGPPHVGRRTLMKYLLESDPSHYITCLPHTSRPPRAGEVNGKDYLFVSREAMEEGIQAGNFLEYGENKGHLYGTAISTVQQAMETNRVPVLDLYPQALKVVGHSGLIPYIIGVAAPRVERLLMTRKVVTDKQRRKSSATSEKEIHFFTESELQELYRNSQEIQAEYSHYFDWVIVNDDLQVAADMLKEVARRIEEEPQWIPASWVEEI